MFKFPYLSHNVFLKQNFLDVYLKPLLNLWISPPLFLAFAFFKKENRSLVLWNFPYPEFYYCIPLLFNMFLCPMYFL